MGSMETPKVKREALPHKSYKSELKVLPSNRDAVALASSLADRFINGKL